ncbi:MAG: hypothetical protein ACREUO_12470 [Burkholderiales bacterium]
MSDELMRKWIENWRRVGPELEAIRRRELQAMTDDDVRRYVSDLFTGPYPDDLPPRRTSGLVEQQRWFALWHQRT